MNYFYWDASALGKRYTAKMGTESVSYLFASVSTKRMMALYIGIGEVMSIMVRKHNTGAIGDGEFAQAIAEFKTEIVDAIDFRLEPVGDTIIESSRRKPRPSGRGGGVSQWATCVCPLEKFSHRLVEGVDGLTYPLTMCQTSLRIKIRLMV